MKRREFIAGLGSAAAWPMAARAQQPALPVVGYLSGTTESTNAVAVRALRQGLGDHGFVEGRNIEILYRWAELQADRLPALAADLVRRRVAVIVAAPSNATALAAKSATATIPIVFVIGADPVELGLVASLNRPGGNVTGTTYFSEGLTPKHLELLHEIVPAVTLIGFLVNPATPKVEARIREAEIAARILGVGLMILNASAPSEIENVFAILAEQRVGAVLVGSDLLFGVQTQQLAALAARYAVPAIYPNRLNVEAGGLISYGTNRHDPYRLAGTYAGRILKGEKPSDLPIQQSTKIELLINMKTAKALGLAIPQSILLRADEVIE
jgi:putative tryptophan/tyrosine transport system substrate-binding protein